MKIFKSDLPSPLNFYIQNLINKLKLLNFVNIYIHIYIYR
jgi:hypothetical protein